MDYTVFYSWQSDTPANANRSFVRQALEAAIGELAGNAEVQDAPRVDSGMEGVSGSPEVASVMFEKIREAAIFVGDVTLVGEIIRHDGERKRVANPNVLLELGYAASTLGWGRVIGVMNEHFGSPQEQSFDLRNRRFPITYRLAPEQPATRVAALNSLSSAISGALRAAVEADYRSARVVVARLDVNCRNLIAAAQVHQRFDEPNPQAFTLDGPLDTPRLGAALTRLLDLGAIRSVRDLGTGSYAYEWTFLGRQIIRELQRIEASAGRA